jgi:hypothetical protein
MKFQIFSILAFSAFVLAAPIEETGETPPPERGHYGDRNPRPIIIENNPRPYVVENNPRPIIVEQPRPTTIVEQPRPLLGLGLGLGIL